MSEKILQIESRGDFYIVAIRAKKLYQNESVRFREEMVSFLETGCRYAVLDLQEVRVMNSSAIGVILLTADQLRKRDGKLAVVGVNDLLMELFERMYLHTLFDVRKTAEEALQTFGRIPPSALASTES
jgi:anti-anti-sigma factor